MNNAIALILSAALIADTLANIARLWGVRATMKQQEEIMERERLEVNARLGVASDIISGTVKKTIAELIAAQEDSNAR